MQVGLGYCGVTGMGFQQFSSLMKEESDVRQEMFQLRHTQVILLYSVCSLQSLYLNWNYSRLGCFNWIYLKLSGVNELALNE